MPSLPSNIQTNRKNLNKSVVHTQKIKTMFAATLLRRRISKYALFMKDTAKSSALAGLSIPERARKLSKMYKALTPAQKSALAVRSYRAAAPKHNASRIARRATYKLKKSNEYAYFTKKMYAKVQGTPSQRIKQIADLWKQAHPKA